MDPTKTTQTPEAKTPDAAAAGTMAVPGAETSTSSTTGALDFTGGSAASGLSMADSLASAQDNLTSAGMAAKDTVNPALGLDQIGSSDPQATMERPDEPLIPAAPVPGSIGSVTSGPAMGAEQPAAAPAAETPAAAAAETPAATVGAPYNPFAAPASETQAVAPAAQAAPAAQTNQPDMSQTSSTNVPMGLQPKTSKFSMKGDKASTLTWILGIAAGVFAIATIVFMVLWIQGMNNQKVVYVPNTPVQPEPVETSATCVMDRVAGAEDGMDGLSGIYSTVNLNFADDKLTNYDVAARYTFGDATQAEAARPLFTTMAALFSAVGAGTEQAPLSASFDVADNVVTLDMKTDVTAALETEGVTLDLPKNEETGEYLLDMASTKEYLTNQGYVCE